MAPAPVSTRARPLLVALAVLGGALLVVVGLLLGAALVGSASTALPAEDSVDAGFARDMQVHHGQAVQMAVLLRDRSDDEELRQMALDIELTQQNQQGQMLGWLQSWGLPQASTQPVMGWLSGPFSDDMADMTMGEDTDAGADDPMVAMGLATPEQVAALEAADGVEAERVFLTLMVAHHRGGVQMASVAQEEAVQPQVRRLATSMVNAQTLEIAVLQELLDARGGPIAV